jgi:hypothetical protein
VWNTSGVCNLLFFSPVEQITKVNLVSLSVLLISPTRITIEGVRSLACLSFWCNLVRIEDPTWGAVPRRIDFVMANLKGNRIEHNTSGTGVQMQ